MIEVQYNPTELSWDKGAQIAEISIPGLDAPLQQFVRGQAEKLTLELFFDTTDHGMGKDAVKNEIVGRVVTNGLHLQAFLKNLNIKTDKLHSSSKGANRIEES